LQTKTIPSLILGGSGYVAAEIIRLVVGHPLFRLDGVVSSTYHGQRVDSVFPHLTGAIGDAAFITPDEGKQLIADKRQIAIFSAMPHGETAAVLANILSGAGEAAKVVDMSADFRFSDPKQFEAIYGHAHGAPALLDKFHCALPELESETPDRYVAHPGCFTTVATLASAPLVAFHLADGPIIVNGVTGSTGSGRNPKQGTHHPERHGAMWAYDPLTHRHEPEMEQLLARLDGGAVDLCFIPHSGPFARGIHATVFAHLKTPMPSDAMIRRYQDFYANAPFITVGERLPTVKEVVGSNRCHMGIVTNGENAVVTAVIDNLVKGASGGAVQWMNRMFGLDETTGLMTPGIGWA
jgi:N-acetyl-gamma-glutamyl-phosphate reductase common form